MTGFLRAIAVLLAAGSLSVACSKRQIAPQQDLSAIADPDAKIPNINLLTHDNRRVRFYDDLVQGRTVLINFMYTKCRGT